MVTIECDGQLKSKIANVNNVARFRYSGGITEALFLKHFISRIKPFAHFDIDVFNEDIRANGHVTKLMLSGLEHVIGA